MPLPKPAVAKPAGARPAAGRTGNRPAGAVEKPGAGGGGRRGLFARAAVAPKALTQFTQQFATLVSAGLPLVRSLRVLEGQLEAGPFRDVVGAVADDVEGGSPLSEALAKYPQAFDRLYVNMVRAGEAGGLLGEILQRLAEFSRKRDTIRGQIKGALTYPAVVLGVAMLIVLFVMIFVVPKFEDVLRNFDVAMPLPTEIVIGISRGLIAWWWVVLVVPVALWAAFRLALRSEGFAWQVDRFKLRVPLFGKLLRRTIIARFARTLGTLLQSGVPILESLGIVGASIPNRVLEDAVEDVRDAIREGETIAGPLGESGVFDDVVVNMIDVGEETGRLDEMLLRIADNVEHEVDSAVSTLFKVIEPLLLVVMAVLVGFIVISLFLPIVRIMDSFPAGG